MIPIPRTLPLHITPPPLTPTIKPLNIRPKKPTIAKIKSTPRILQPTSLLHRRPGVEPSPVVIILFTLISFVFVVREVAVGFDERATASVFAVVFVVTVVLRDGGF